MSNALFEWFNEEMKNRELTKDEVSMLLEIARNAIRELEEYKMRTLEIIEKYRSCILKRVEETVDSVACEILHEHE